MAEALIGASGQALPLDPAEQQFAAAMAAPEPPANGQSPDYPPPPRRDPAAPHGRDAQGNPLAPHGFKADGGSRRDLAGRPSPAGSHASSPKTPAGRPRQPRQRRQTLLRSRPGGPAMRRPRLS
jgi:hypothetical protein